MAYTDVQHDEDTTLLNPPSYDETIIDDLENIAELPLITKETNKSYMTYVISMAIGLVLVAMNGNMVFTTYASIGSELNQLQSASWIPTAYMVTQTSFQPLAGKLSDIFGRKACLVASYVIYTFGCLVFGLSTSMTYLIIGRAISGIGSGGITILVTIIMSDVVPLRVRGTWQGVITLISAIGSLIGAPLGGLFVDSIGWRWPFLLQVPLFAIACLAVQLTLRLPATKRSANLKRIDFGGAITLVLAILFLLLGLDRGGNVTWSDWRTVGSLIASAIFTALFVFTEMHIASEPFAPTRIVANRALLPCYITNFFGAAALSILAFYIQLFCQAVEGMSASKVSVIWVFSTLAGMVGSLSSGFILQHTGRYYSVTVISYLLIVVGTGIAFLSSGVVILSTFGLAIGMCVTEIGSASGITTTLISLIAHAGQADQATATAMTYLFRSLGCVIGVFAGGTLVQNTLRNLLQKRLSGDDVQE
ncbi:hypothetical protein APHAL10511_003308, partial [Amanita phalloides]